MTTKADHLRALSRICRRYGGRLVIIAQDLYDDLFEDARRDPDLNSVGEAPFTSALGIHWRKKIIYTVRGREEVGAIIHEMGHVFADRHHPESYKCKEFDWFDWEYAVARQIGALRSWSQHNGNYVIDDHGTEWRRLNTRKRRHVIAERLNYAKEIGVVDSAGRPRNVR